jgi:hypothetical protein
VDPRAVDAVGSTVYVVVLSAYAVPISRKWAAGLRRNRLTHDSVSLDFPPADVLRILSQLSGNNVAKCRSRVKNVESST